MQGMGATAMAGLAPVGAGAVPSLLHEEIARKAGALARGQTTTLRLLLPHGSGSNVAPVAAAFAELSGIGVERTETGVDEIGTVLTLDALSGGQNYDLALPPTFALPDLVSSGSIVPLTAFADIHEPATFREDFLYRIGDSYDGEIYGFQTDGDAYVMFYHRDMLKDPDEKARYADRFGTALARPQTWEELDRQIAYFNRPEEDRWGGLLFRTTAYLAWEWWVRFHAKGIWPFSSEMEPQVASDGGVEALEQMIRVTEHLNPEALRLDLFGNWRRYSRGDIYCNIGWGGSQKYLNGPNSRIRGRMAFGHTPGGIVDGRLLTTPYFNWGWDYVVTANAPQPELAYLFALFASTAEMSTRAVREPDGFFDPYREEHYRDAGIRAAYSPEFLKIHKASMAQAIPDLYLKGQSEYFRVLGNGLGRALAGEIGPKEALERVAQRWRLITNAAGRSQQVRRWAGLRAKYPAGLRRALRDVA